MAARTSNAPETNLSEPSDHSLLRRMRSGDEDAATCLYHRYADRVLALARRRHSAALASRVDAEDIVQSVFRVFFREARRGRYDVPAGEDLWKLLLVLALNRIRSEHAHHRAAKRDVRSTTGGEAFEQALLLPSGRGGPAPEFFRLAVADAFDRLSPRHRAVVELRLAGYDVAEIAAQTQRSKRTTERALQEARQLLHDLLPHED